MDKLQISLTHINGSVKDKIDRDTFIACIEDLLFAKKWAYHIKTFFLETPLPRMHDIVLAGILTFESLYFAHLKWDPEGYANNETTEWIKEMYYLQMGRAHELGPDRFI
jgi:hypothetical protein